MSRDSSGNCTRTKTGGYVAGQDILAAEVNSEIDDIINMLTYSLSRDGKGAALANISMGGYKITELAEAKATGEAVRYDELISGLAMKAAKGANTDITSLASPYIAGATADTQTAGNNTTKVATTAFVTTAVAPKAADSAVVHNTGTETIAGQKTFSTNPVASNIPKYSGYFINLATTPSWVGNTYGGNSPTISRTAAGRYSVNFPGLSSISNIQCTAADSNGNLFAVVVAISGAFATLGSRSDGGSNGDPDGGYFVTVYGS